MGLIPGASMLHLGSARPLDVGGLVVLSDTGTRLVTWAPEPVTVRINVPPVSLPLARPDGTVEACLPGASVAEATLKADQSNAVERVLRLRNEPKLRLTNLSRILEVIRKYGGPLGASKAELNRFTQTANSRTAAGDRARHGHGKIKPPRKKMELHEARGLMDRIIRVWLASK